MRKIFTWVDPTTDELYEDICTTPQLRDLLENIIEEDEQAESFFEAYSQVCDDAEYNIGYLANLISDSDIREDVLDLFLVDPQVEPRQLLNREYLLSRTVRNG